MTAPAAARALVALAAVLVVATAASAYAWRALFDADQFADRASAALQDPSVRDAVAERVTDDLVLGAQPDLLAGRPVIASTVSGSRGWRGVREPVPPWRRDVHRAVFGADRDTVTLTLVDLASCCRPRCSQLDAGARRPPAKPRERIEVLSRDIGGVTADLARLADRSAGSRTCWGP